MLLHTPQPQPLLLSVANPGLLPLSVELRSRHFRAFGRKPAVVAEWAPGTVGWLQQPEPRTSGFFSHSVSHNDS